MKTVLTVLVVITIVLFALWTYAITRHYLDFGHIPPFGLHADLVVEDASIGIPGISKMHEGRLFNFGLPTVIQQCNGITDAMEREVKIAYAVERRGASSNQWETLVTLTGDEHCRPYPLGLIHAEAVERWLWPGQSVASSSEATTARDGFKKGDFLRFTLFTRLNPQQDPRAVAIHSGETIVTEEVTNTQTPFRIAH